MRVTRAAVIETAGQIADRDGLGGVSLKAVAEALHIRTPSLYNHISSLEDLLRQVAHAGMRTMNAALERAAVGVSGGEAVLAVCAAYLRCAAQHPGVYETIQWATWHGTEETAQIFGSYLSLMRTLICSCGLRPEGTEEILDLLTGALHGYTSMQLRYALTDLSSAQTRLRRAMSTLLAGVRQEYGPESAPQVPGGEDGTHEI